MPNKRRERIWLSVMVIGILFAVMLLLNHWMPLHRDDYDYSLIWGTSQPIASLADVCASVGRHFLLHGGRVVTVFCLDLFLWLGKVWFDIANAALFAGLVLLLYLHARRGDASRGMEPLILAAAALLAWLSFPHFGEVALWKSGSTVYLWSGFFAACFLLPYNVYLKQGGKEKAWLAGPMFLLGLLAGCSVENLGVTVVLVSAAAAWYCHHRGHTVVWMVTGAIGAAGGFAVLLAAPGNYVRYGVQGQGKGILLHIGNQFAGNGEMLLYLLPMLLLLLLIWRILQAELLRKREGIVFAPRRQMAWGSWILWAVLAGFVYSYFNGGFIAAGIRDFLIAQVMAPLGLITKHTVEHFANVMAGFEEMAIYWMLLFLLYYPLRRRLGFSHANRVRLAQQVTAQEVWQSFPEVRYAGRLFLLALFTNLVMMAAPTFPARATFGATAMIIIGVLALLRMPVVQARLFSQICGKLLLGGAAALGLFTVAASLAMMHEVDQANSWRVALVREARETGQPIVYLPPLDLHNRALRHVFFVDFDNGVTKDGLCHYYGIKDIKVER